MSGPAGTCTRCGASVPSVLSGPPDERDTWWRNRARMVRREVHHVMRFSIIKRRWLPKHPGDQVAETFTTLDLCDRCSGEVFLFAQGKSAVDQRLALAREALVGTGYFTADEVGPDIAPRIVEMHSALTRAGADS